MSSRTVVGLAAVLVVSSVAAQGQAAAEAALANAHSSTATAKAGSALGRALNQGSGQLTRRIQQVAPVPVQVHRPQASGQVNAQAKAGALTAATPTGSALIVAVHGGEPPACAPANQHVEEQNATASVSPNCGKVAPLKAKPQTQYRSAVTLSFPKQ